jgi:hypothetical protein
MGIFASAPFIADFVGNGSLGMVVEIEVSGKPDLLSAYAMYSQDTNAIERLALVNSKEWYPDSSTDRGVASISLNVADGVDTATIRRLHADNGAAAMGLDLVGADDNVTWAGEQWTHTVDRGLGHFPTGHPMEETEGKERPGDNCCARQRGRYRDFQLMGMALFFFFCKRVIGLALLFKLTSKIH